jgi:hypothetical protein
MLIWIFDVTYLDFALLGPLAQISHLLPEPLLPETNQFAAM